MGKRFAKGDECYVVRKDSQASLHKGHEEHWEKYKVSVKSSGKKYVTVTSTAVPKVVFMTADKDILMSGKSGVYLVETEEFADRLIEKLSEPAEAAG